MHTYTHRNLNAYINIHIYIHILPTFLTFSYFDCSSLSFFCSIRDIRHMGPMLEPSPFAARTAHEVGDAPGLSGAATRVNANQIIAHPPPLSRTHLLQNQKSLLFCTEHSVSKDQVTICFTFLSQNIHKNYKK